MKDHELRAIDLALAEFPREVASMAPTLTAVARNEFRKPGPVSLGSELKLEDFVNRLTTREALEVAYRLLGRLLENVSSWRRLLRWAIGKVMELLAGAKDRV